MELQVPLFRRPHVEVVFDLVPEIFLEKGDGVFDEKKAKCTDLMVCYVLDDVSNSRLSLRGG